jgi:hypothetical protein
MTEDGGQIFVCRYAARFIYKDAAKPQQHFCLLSPVICPLNVVAFAPPPMH